MFQSVVTRKGQTTIPKEIRNLLNIRPNDKLFYIVEGGKVFLKPIHGDILELRGCVSADSRPQDYTEVIKKTRKRVSKKIVEDL